MADETGVEPESQRSLGIILIVAAVIILFFFCCALGVVLWFTGDPILEYLDLAGRQLRVMT